jgi:hypothetical protein
MTRDYLDTIHSAIVERLPWTALAALRDQLDEAATELEMDGQDASDFHAVVTAVTAAF